MHIDSSAAARKWYYWRAVNMKPDSINRSIAVAPMMDWTDRHCRYFLRLISRHTLLYTEMVTTNDLLGGDLNYLLGYDPAEQPLALQLGGSDPQAMADCAAMAEDFGYDEVNMNVGCPSDRVSSGRFGACLMAEPERVARCVEAMRQRVGIPVTVKTRIGIDHQDSYADLKRFVATVAAAGCSVFIVHARKAWLSGLSPKENREVPPLRYDTVARLKEDFPGLQIVLNGGLTDLEAVAQQLQRFDGVMIGREAYHNPYVLAQVDRQFFGSDAPLSTRKAIVQSLLPYVERQLALGGRLNHITRHILGLFQGQPGARAWRRHLSENAHRPGAGAEVIEAALAKVL